VISAINRSSFSGKLAEGTPEFPQESSAAKQQRLAVELLRRQIIIANRSRLERNSVSPTLLRLASVKTQKIPDPVNNVLVVVAIAIGVLSVLRVRQGGGVTWFIALGVCGYFVVAGLYQKFFR
jgi:hypothetical protein